jgi:hypothetical protein
VEEKIGYQSRSQYLSPRKDVQNCCKDRNSPVERLGASGCGKNVAVVILEVKTHRRGAAITGHELLVAVLAGRLSGGFVVGCLGKVEPNLASGPATSLYAVMATVWG